MSLVIVLVMGILTQAIHEHVGTTDIRPWTWSGSGRLTEGRA